MVLQYTSMLRPMIAPWINALAPMMGVMATDLTLPVSPGRSGAKVLSQMAASESSPQPLSPLRQQSPLMGFNPCRAAADRVQFNAFLQDELYQSAPERAPRPFGRDLTLLPSRPALAGCPIPDLKPVSAADRFPSRSSNALDLA